MNSLSRVKNHGATLCLTLKSLTRKITPHLFRAVSRETEFTDAFSGAFTVRPCLFENPAVTFFLQR